jgi:hypothetical protein
MHDNKNQIIFNSHGTNILSTRYYARIYLIYIFAKYENLQNTTTLMHVLHNFKMATQKNEQKYSWAVKNLCKCLNITLIFKQEHL